MNIKDQSLLRSHISLLAFLIAVLALPIVAQTRTDVDPYQKISLKTTRPCTVPASGEVTSLVKNGVELSVTEDFDCDGVPDAYDNCVGMPNRDQADSDGNGIGDVCEAAITIKTGLSAKSRSNIKPKSPTAPAPVKSSSNTKAKSRKAQLADKRSRPSVRRRRRR
jgi:thrombospondin type 3 repeat protein